jgi:hypothetical protein
MIENEKYNAMAVSKMTFLPQMSENLDHIGAATAFARRYAALIQAYPDADLKLLLIVGIAVATIV